jgi:hypothetical protein
MRELIAIDAGRFNDDAYIEARAAAAPAGDGGSLRTALSYLYKDDGPVNLPRERLLSASPHLDDAERVVMRWLYTRTNGSERKNYGAKALLAARRARYRCEACGFPDVRVRWPRSRPTPGNPTGGRAKDILRQPAR